ncbi:unnamed protein product [Rotaria magnacalcarata]|uniref:Uncharacterized protein n=1 Tax=Rotaria magnacalcarata TaxID=392030 RepID=A0A816URV1_9BILA|nr:unnamed protein product [Rotaria magnacalcarata]CAF3974363.1 unnamed protein product [Rotaria magnacalcarata]
MKQTQATTNATVAASSTNFRARPRRVVQNFVLVWLDAHIDEKKEDFRNSFTELRKIVVTLETFTEVDQCIEYLKSINDQKIFLIISGSVGQTMMPLIHKMTQLDTIFVFCSNKDRHKVWAKGWPKVEGVHGSRCHSSSIFAPQLNVRNSTSRNHTSILIYKSCFTIFCDHYN